MNLKFILFCSLCCFSSVLIATTITVNQDGSADYAQINLAVEASADGDTIKVYPGTYEGNILLEDRHNLLIASLYHWTEIDSFKYNTIIDGEMENFGFRLDLCSNITIKGFTIKECVGEAPFYSGAGINIKRSDLIKILNNFITDNYAYWGAGILVAGNFPEFINNVELNNNVITKNYAVFGAGLCFGQYSQIIMESNSSNSVHSNYASCGADLFWDSNIAATIYIDTMSIVENDSNFDPYYFYDREGNCDLSVNNYKFELIDSDIYVDAENGNNNNNGTETEPMQTITHALSRIKSTQLNSNTVFVDSGLYNFESCFLPIKDNINLIGLTEEVNLDYENRYSFGLVFSSADINFLKNNEISKLNIFNLSSLRTNIIMCNEIESFSLSDLKFSNITLIHGFIEFWKTYNQQSKVIINNLQLNNFTDARTLYCINQDIDIINCTFKNSEYTYWGEGGGKCTMRFAGYQYDPVWPTINIINTEITNNEAANNWPGESGTDTAISTGYMTNVNIINSTIANNRGVPSYYHPSGEYGRAIQFWEQDSHVNIVNSIIYGNDEYDLGYKDPGFYEQNNNYSLNVVNSIVGNHEIDINDENISFNSVWDENPEFAGEEAEYPFALQEASYAINAGVMNYLEYLPEGFEFPTTDLAGNPRISGDIIDLGAYEYQQPNSVPESEEYETPNETFITNYPNPGSLNFRAETATQISLNLVDDGEYKLEIYNVKGQKVRTILDAFIARGIHSYNWNGRDRNNKIVSSGNYLVKLSQHGKTVSTHQITMLK